MANQVDKKNPVDVIEQLEKDGTIDKLKKAGIIDRNYDVEGLKQKARSTSRKSWWVVCPEPGDPGYGGSCIGYVEW